MATKCMERDEAQGTCKGTGTIVVEVWCCSDRWGCACGGWVETDRECDGCADCVPCDCGACD